MISNDVGSSESSSVRIAVIGKVGCTNPYRPPQLAASSEAGCIGANIAKLPELLRKSE